MSNDKTLAFLDREAMALKANKLTWHPDEYCAGWLAAHKGPRVQALLEALEEILSSQNMAHQDEYMRNIAKEALREFQSERE